MRLWGKQSNVAEPKPCVNCKGTDVELNKIAMGSTAQCKGCGYTVKLGHIGVTELALRRAWNHEDTRLRDELRGLYRRIRELRKLGVC